jgi:hypothetical protein
MVVKPEVVISRAWGGKLVGVIELTTKTLSTCEGKMVVGLPIVIVCEVALAAPVERVAERV